jgi:hypothetical protein
MHDPKSSTAEAEERLTRLFSEACAELLRIVEATTRLMQELDEIEIRVDRLETARRPPGTTLH